MDDHRSGSLSLEAVVDLLREDAAAAELRSQRLLDAMEGRVLTAVSELRGDFTGYVTVHGKEHIAGRAEAEAAHKRYDAFIQREELAAARRDGMLGMIRYGADLLGRNWRGIAALAAGIAVVSGNIHISFGVTP